MCQTGASEKGNGYWCKFGLRGIAKVIMPFMEHYWGHAWATSFKYKKYVDMSATFFICNLVQFENIYGGKICLLKRNGTLWEANEGKFPFRGDVGFLFFVNFIFYSLIFAHFVSRSCTQEKMTKLLQLALMLLVCNMLYKTTDCI